MKMNSNKLIILVVLFAIIFGSCSTLKETEGPYFGNGFHNGWADQTSIVIWTRLTQNPEGNWEGTEFIDVSGQAENELDEEGNAEKIHAAQIPEGLTLDDTYLLPFNGFSKQSGNGMGGS